MTEKFRDELTGSVDARRTADRDAQCGRAEEVVAYLYGETNDGEAASFTQHLAACASCRDEAAAFGGVREQIGEWRVEAVRLTPSLGVGDAISPTLEPAKAQPRRRSARAALREFFALSPWWMQAGTAAAALVLCALAVLSIARAEVRRDGIAFGANPRDTIGKTDEGPIPSGITQSQVNEMLANHAREVAALLQQLQEKEASLIAAREKVSLAETASVQVVTTSSKARQRRRRSDGANAGRTNDSYLAGNNEEDLPRLYDLLRDVN